MKKILQNSSTKIIKVIQQNKVLLKKCKTTIYKVYLKAIPTHNAETWALTSRKKENPSSEDETEGKMGRYRIRN
jgi:hypothetical protein